MTSDLAAQFDRILEREGPALRRLALAYAKTVADGDDLFQDICLALWRALPNFRGDCSERTFAFRIGHNRGLTFRARQRTDLSPLPEDLRDVQPGPETLAVAAVERDRLLHAIQRLPDGHRQVVLLSLEGLSHAEIGDVLGITENNVAVRLSRARKELRALLAPEGVLR